MNQRGPANPERSFGVSVGPVLLAIAAYFLWRGRIGGAATLGFVGALLFVLGLVRPILLKWPSAVWWRISRVLGYVNARVLLTIIFVLLFAPMGVLWRLTGRDPLGRQRSTWPGWSPHPERYRNRAHYSHMY
jgi:hypothetical protein